MRNVAFYHLETGLLANFTVFCSDEVSLAGNTPPGHAAIDLPVGGKLDHLSQRVDVEKLRQEDDAAATAWMAKRSERQLAHLVQSRAAIPVKESTGAAFVDPPPPRTIPTADHILAYQPPAPSADHEWNPATKRWQLNAAAQARETEKRQAAAEIRRLEADQNTLMLEHLVAPTADTAAKLLALHSSIAALRAKL